MDKHEKKRQQKRATRKGKNRWTHVQAMSKKGNRNLKTSPKALFPPSLLSYGLMKMAFEKRKVSHEN
jgi:hypothetical protein